MDRLNRSLSIASVTVAHNGAGVLRAHLDSLKAQTRKLDEIIVLDNASIDGTAELVAREYPEVTEIRLATNDGIGGGLAAGLAYAALDRKHDWVWIFDQDSLPESNSLERLLAGLNNLNGTRQKMAVLAPVCIHPATEMVCHGLAWRGARLIPTPHNPDQELTFVDSVISSGSLIRREALEAVGLPRKDFFMDFVDHEHCLRLRRHGYQIAIVRDSRVHHALGEPRSFNLFGRKKYWSDHVPWREYYMTRNEIFTLWHYYPRFAVKTMALCRVARHALDIAVFGKQKLNCLSMMARGFRDGRGARLGIRHFHNESLAG